MIEPARLALLLTLALIGCGRVQYEALAAEADGGADADARAPTGCDRFPDALFCDGFEQGGDLWAWKQAEVGNEVGIESERAHAGASALRSFATSVGSAWWLTDVFRGADTGDAWVRAYVLVPSSAATAHISTVQIVSGEPPYRGVVVNLGADGRVHLHSSESGTSSPQSAVLFPRDRWVCVRLHVTIADAGRAELYLDDDLVVSYETDTLPAVGYHNVHVGLWYQPADVVAPAELWTDEVLADDAEVPCD